MIPRTLAHAITTAMSESPVVLLQGARQVGKSTLLGQLHAEGVVKQVLSLDEDRVFAHATGAPEEFIASLPDGTAIDEVQRAPELFRALKLHVDRRRSNGRFLLTGSANILLLPKLSETLAGRMAILTLLPFSQGEIEGHRETFIDRLFSGGPWPALAASLDADGLRERWRAGGYPPAQGLGAQARARWFDSYQTTLLQRTIPEITRIEGVRELPQLLALLGARTGNMSNVAELSRSSSLPQTTLRRYLTVLQAAFMIHVLPAWTRGLTKRLIRTPKIHVLDAGLAAHLMQLGSARPNDWGAAGGQLAETFVLGELLKHAGWSEARVGAFYFRSASGAEVDIVLEGPGGRVAGIEVKAGATPHPREFRGLQALAEVAGERFAGGVLLHTGSEAWSFSERLSALPMEYLWRA